MTTLKDIQSTCTDTKVVKMLQGIIDSDPVYDTLEIGEETDETNRYSTVADIGTSDEDFYESGKRLGYTILACLNHDVGLKIVPTKKSPKEENSPLWDAAVVYQKLSADKLRVMWQISRESLNLEQN